MIDTFVPYFKAGLENKEFCLWVVPDSLKKDEAHQLTAVRLTRKRADHEVAMLNVELEQRVQERTQQLAQLSTELSAANKSLEQLSLHDGLTSLEAIDDGREVECALREEPVVVSDDFDALLRQIVIKVREGFLQELQLISRSLVMRASSSFSNAVNCRGSCL